MKGFSNIVFVLSGTLLILSTNSAAIPNSDNPTTFLGPTARVGFTGGTPDINVYSISGEGGYRNVRLDGTFGIAFMDNQRLKISAEYLLQNISYPFFSGNTTQWVQQGSLGADYLYDMGEYTYLYNPQINVGAYLSHAPSKTLRVETGTFVNNMGQLVAFTNNKRIAGSNAVGLSPGFSLYPWRGGNVGFNLNYDDVRYDTTFISSPNVKGFGGTAHLIQAFDGIEVGASAGVREPFNNYQAHLTWTDIPFFGDWLIGVMAEYTTGKNNLPSTYNVGVSVDYLLVNPTGPSMAEREEAINFLSWGAKSAAYMPEVLAIPNQQVTTFIVL